MAPVYTGTQRDGFLFLGWSLSATYCFGGTLIRDPTAWRCPGGEPPEATTGCRACKGADCILCLWRTPTGAQKMSGKTVAVATLLPGDFVAPRFSAGL